MVNVTDSSTVQEMMRARFEASLSERARRAERVKLQHFIPAHWFATAASECAMMFIGGHFYGAISVAQAYVEAAARSVLELRNDFHHLNKEVPTEYQSLQQIAEDCINHLGIAPAWMTPS